jgi:hypothetical protein
MVSLGDPVSTTNKIDCHNITEILLKVVLNTITPITYLIQVLEVYTLRMLANTPNPQEWNYSVFKFMKCNCD